jgi:hypothetical protein
MRTIILICFPFLLLTFCNNPANNQKKDKPEENKKVVDKKEKALNSMCVVLYMPDSLELVELKGTKSQEELSDIEYDKTLVSEFMESKNIPFIIEDVRYYKFIKTNGEEVVLDKKNYQNWGIILFKPEKDPKVVFLNAIKEEYKAYFE